MACLNQLQLKLLWLAHLLRTNGLAPRWNNLRNVPSTVIGRRCLDSDEVREIQTKLNGVTNCCTCPNDEVHLNQIVKILEDEEVVPIYGSLKCWKILQLTGEILQLKFGGTSHQVQDQYTDWSTKLLRLLQRTFRK